jgi:hypothetical protein
MTAAHQPMNRHERLRIVDAINRELERLREQRSQEQWGTSRHSQLREQIAALLGERDAVNQAAGLFR